MSPIKTQLSPPQAKGHTSVARLTRFWYVVAQSGDLKAGQHKAIELLGVPLVIFRSGRGEVGALLDRCPHRNVPLSCGKVKGEHLECGYHGWRFDTEGQCQAVPGLEQAEPNKGRKAPGFATLERDGLIWVWGEPDEAPQGEPFALPLSSDARYTTAIRRVEADASVHATIENALDVPHTAFLHKGLFRGAGEPNTIDVVVRRWHDRVEAEYIGEPRPEGVVGRFLSPSGGLVTHFDRFFLPSVAQVEYRIGEENHILVTSLCTPVSDFVTHMYAVISFRMRLPSVLVKPILEPLARSIFAQDARILKRQTEVIHRFGGEQFVSTDLDVLGSHIWRLMTQAERGTLTPTEDPVVKEFQMRV